MKRFPISRALVNKVGENITMFPVEDGVIIEKNEFVVVNTRTFQASLPKKESGYISVGRATEIITTEDGITLVLCRDGIFKCQNSKDWKHRIGKGDYGRDCFFEDDQTVSLNNKSGIKAGTVINLDDGVWIKIDVNERGGN